MPTTADSALTAQVDNTPSPKPQRQVRFLGPPLLLKGRGGCGYTFGMKTAVSIPDVLFRKADELAGRMGKSRSEVYRDALADYVSRRDPGAITRALDEIADELSAEERAFTTAAARRTLAQSEW
jgi:predicted transcriptional regulator